MMTATSRFSDSWEKYLKAGWAGVLHLPSGEKEPPPAGYTGDDGMWPTAAQIARWADKYPDRNICLRMPLDVIGIDIDCYKGSEGEVRANLEALTGPLPPTWCSTSRVDGSGIRFYRTQVLPKGVAWATDPVTGVEIIQHRHRYAIVSPSLHPEGRQYRWVDEASGEVDDDPPDLDDLTELPWAAAEALMRKLEQEKPRNGEAFEITTGDMTPLVAWELRQAIQDTKGERGSRHDAMCRRVLTLVRYAERGEDGVESALKQYRQAFIDNLGDDRAPGKAEREFDQALKGAIRRVRNTAGTIPTKAERDAEASGEWLINPSGTKQIHEAVPASEPWADPIPLRNATDLPPFPIHALPAWMAEHAEAVALELQAPVDLPAMLGLAALSVAAAKRARITVRGAWQEPANLYLVVAMPPSSGKSPAYNAMIKPLRDFEREQLERATPAIAKRTQERRILEAGMKKAEAKGDADEANRFLMDLLGSEPLHPPRLMTDDATPEAVVRMLGEQKGRLAIMSPEGGLFDMMAGRYSDTSNLDPYLKAWSGDTIIVDRMSRETISVDNPALTIGLTVQPSVIAALGDKPEMAGRGLTARFMYAIPADVVGRRNMINPPIADPALGVEYRRRLLSVASANYEHPIVLDLDEGARRAFLSWRQSLEDQRGPYGDMRPMAEWSTKLESSVARLALLLHIADHGYAGTVADETMTRAIEIGAYWIEHGKAAHDMWVIDPTRSSALAILNYIKEKSVAEFTLRELWRGLRRRFAKPVDLIEPLTLLLETGWLRPTSDGPLEIGRGVPSPSFAAHPSATPQNRVMAPVAPVAPAFDPEGSRARVMAPVAPVAPDSDEKSLSDYTTFHIVAPVAPVALKVKKSLTSSSSLEEGGTGEGTRPLATGDMGAMGASSPDEAKALGPEYDGLI